MSFSIHFRHPNNPTHCNAGSWSCDSGQIPWNHSVFQWTASRMKPASGPFTHTTLYISWGCGSPEGTGVPGIEVAAGTCEKRIRPRALVCRDSKPRVSVPKLVYLVPCCTENLFFPSLSPSSFLIPLLPLLYHVFLLLPYLPIFLVLLVLRILIPCIISMLFLTSSYFY